jgi:hypothetical protein
MASTAADMPATETTNTTEHSHDPDSVLSIAPIPKKATKKAKHKYITRKQANALVIDAGEAAIAALKGLEAARELADKAGLSVDSSILGNDSSGVDLKTGGHSNTDHIVVRTGDPRTDRIAELKRNLQRRSRAMKPEDRGENM